MELIKKLADEALIRSRWNLIYQNKNKKARRMSKGIDGISIRDFKEKEKFYLKEIFTSLQNQQYQFNDIKCSTRKKSSGGHRIISEPTVRDRIVHKAIHKIINPIIYPIINTEVSYCGIKKNIDENEENAPNIKHAIEELIYWVKVGNFWIFESDIKGFFDHVSKKRIFEKIKHALHPDYSINELIKQIIFYNIGNEEALIKNAYEIPSSIKGIAQGSSLSPLFANLYLSNFDKEMKKKFNKRFIRYVDDFIVICKTKEEAMYAKNQAIKILKIDKLSLSRKKSKTRIVNLSQNGAYIDFLGLRINKNKIAPKKPVGTVNEWLRTKILKKKNYEIRLIKDQRGKIKQRIPIIDQMNEAIRGWGEFYKYYHVINHFSKIDSFLENFKKGKPFFKNLISLDEITREPLIAEEEWKNYFTRH